jgi:hypothetical protein
MRRDIAKFVLVTLICVVALVIAAAQQPSFDDGVPVALCVIAVS